MTTISITQEHLDRYAEKVKATRKRMGLLLEVEVGFDEGPKFIRVYTIDPGHGGRSAFSFIEKATGEIIDAYGWKKRGRRLNQSVFDSE